MSDWEKITPAQLRVAAVVARASGGLAMAAAAEAWELRADLIESYARGGFFNGV